MRTEQTLSIIKPDGVKRNLIGEIVKRFEKNNLKIVAAKVLLLSQENAKSFYKIHKDKGFFEELTLYMSSGPIFVSVLQGKNAVSLNRSIMGATNPEEAKEGSIRYDFSKSIGENTVHGSDSIENAKNEISFFFSELEIKGK